MSDSLSGSKSDLLGGELSQVTPRTELQKLLECPVCHSIPTAPIYNCLQGHSICSRCRTKIDKCPLCQALCTLSRNFTLEAIVESSTFACDNREQGCLAVVLGKDIQSHNTECGFRPIRCHLGSFHGCNSSSVDVKNYLSHLMDTHKVQQCDRNYENAFTVAHILRDFNVADVSWCGKYIDFDGKKFLTRSFLHTGSFHFCVVLIGDDVQAKNYSVKVRLGKRGQAKGTLFEIRMPVCPVRMSDTEIMEDCLHGILNKSILKKVCDIEEIMEETLKLRWEVHYELEKVSAVVLK